MKVAVIKEIKDRENRVGLTPEGAKRLVAEGNEVLVESDAGVNSGFSNEEYGEAGASIVNTEEAWNSEMVIKVKEPMELEYKFLKEHIVFTYFHLAGVTKTLTDALLKRRTTAIAYETIEDEWGRLPLLAPMSAVAGNMSALIGSYYLAKFNNGRGVQLGSVLGERHGKVLVIGDGVVGSHAARTAYGMGANVYIAGLNDQNYQNLKEEVGDGLEFIESTQENISEHVKDADLVVGAVLLHGAKAPYVVTKDMVKTMQKGSVIVDVSIDQGGCIETSRPTTHSDPVYEIDGVTHYCVTNMPGAYPRTSTLALTSATLPYVLKLAKRGIDALVEDKGFRKGLNAHKGFLIYKSVAEALGLMDKFREFDSLVLKH